MKRNWTAQPPYKHSWTQSYQSPINPQKHITFPQLLAERIYLNRCQAFKKPLPKGEGWSNSCGIEYRKLVQQAYVICNYFEHPDVDIDTYNAVNSYLTLQRPLTIGAYRKSRMTKDGNCSVTPAEKSTVNAIQAELDKLKTRKDIRKTHDDVKLSSMATKVDLVPVSVKTAKKTIRNVMSQLEKLDSALKD